MPERIEVDGVWSGSGPLLPAHVGAYAQLEPFVTFKRVGGSSGGAVVAAGKALGMPSKDMLGLCSDVINKELLDLSWWPFDRWGVYNGDRLHSNLKQIFPMRMGDLKTPLVVFVCDLWTRRPRAITSWGDPNVEVADALRASISIPGFFKAVRIESDNARLYIDGGVSVNFAHAFFDDVDRPTLGFRFKTDVGEPKPVRSTADWVRAVASLLMYSSNEGHISSKRVSSVVDITTKGDLLDFDLTPAKVRALYEDGWRSSMLWQKNGGLAALRSARYNGASSVSWS